MPLAPGARIGPYEVLSPLGAGGMGEVYRARDARLDREVALKVLPEDVRENVDRLARFRREAKLLASLNHPNVGAIYGLEEGVGGGPPVLVLELVSGRTLDEILAHGPMEIAEALGLAVQIADGLEAAHELGIVHRDLKPSNVKLTDEGRIKILDFGLAKARVIDPSAPPPGQLAPMTTPTITTGGTRLGVVLGTVTYMSPEQARGKPVDRRTDIWSFGCLLYECLTSWHAFGGETAPETIGAILHLEPDWSKLPPATPPRVRALLLRCLEKDPRKRLRDIGDARVELEEALSPIPAPVGSAPAVARSRRRALQMVVLVAVALAGVAAGSLVTRNLIPRESAGRVARVSIEVPPSIEMRSTDFDFSPDGRCLVIVGRPRRERGAPPEPYRLYARRLDGYDFTAIKGSEGALLSAFSPDGRWLAFVAQASRDSSRLTLMKIALDGFSPPIVVGPWDDAWQGLVWLDGSDFLTAAAGGRTLVRLAGSDARPAAPVEVRAGGSTISPDFFMRVLPGGRRVLAQMVSYAKRGYQLGISSVDLRTGEATTVVADGGSAFFLPTGQLAFSRGDTILVVPFDLGKNALIAAPVAILDGLLIDSSWLHGSFGLSQDGTLAYAPGGRVGANRGLVVATPGGSVESWSDEKRAFETPPSVSPDERRAAVVIPSAEAIYEIWIVEKGRPGLRRLISVPEADTGRPVWSPDGSTLAYYRIGRTPADGIYVARADGTGAPRRIVRVDDFARRPLLPSAWTPDGASVLAVDNADGKTRLVRVPVAPETGESAEKMVPLVTGPGSAGSPRLSRDGSWLAWDSDETGKREVYVGAFGRDGTVGSPIPVSRGGGARPAWAADGRTLYFVTPDEHVMAVAFDPRTGAASPPKPHLDLAPVRAFRPLDNVEILADGRVFTIQKGDDEAEVRRIDLVLNWTRELRGK